MSLPAIDAEKLSKSYALGPRRRLLWALRDVSFQVKPGEIVGIIGKNGSGKSTLLNILARITEPTRGRAVMRGRAGSLLEAGTGFHPELTGEENIYLGGALLGMKRREVRRRYEEIVSFAEIGRFLDVPIKRYSTGMRLRLAFAVAAHVRPDIFLIDEVLTVGDVAFQRKCLEKLQEIARAGTAMLIVSHSMHALAGLCSRVIWIDKGKKVAEGPTAEMIRRYACEPYKNRAEVSWPDLKEAPGNEVVRLRAVRVLQPPRRQPVKEVLINRDVILQLEYQNFRANAPLYAAVHLKDELGLVVLASANNLPSGGRGDSWAGRQHPKGVFRAECRLPAHFLNDGTYLVTAIVGRGISDTQAMANPALSFKVRDTGEGRGGYQGEWAGVVRPWLNWRSEPLRS